MEICPNPTTLARQMTLIELVSKLYPFFFIFIRNLKVNLQIAIYIILLLMR